MLFRLDSTLFKVFYEPLQATKGTVFLEGTGFKGMRDSDLALLIMRTLAWRLHHAFHRFFMVQGD